MSSNPGSQLLQDHQAADGPEEGKEEAAGAELAALPDPAGLCLRCAPRLHKLRQVQRGEWHESYRPAFGEWHLHVHVHQCLPDIHLSSSGELSNPAGNIKKK